MFNETNELLQNMGLHTIDRELFEARAWIDILRDYSPSVRGTVTAILSELLEHEEYAECVRWTWVHSEGDLNEIQFDSLFFNHGRGQISFMSESEQQVYDQFGDVIQIYRGCSLDTIQGRSWSISEQVAREFAGRDGGQGILLVGHCRRGNVIAYFNDEPDEPEIIQEQEILINFENVFNIEQRFV